MSGVQQTINRLRDLRLTSMAEAYTAQLQQPKLYELSFDDRFGLLVEQEVSDRESRKLKRLVREAALPETASLEDIDYRSSRGIDKSAILHLANCEWVRQHLNLIVIGPTGAGKTWLACAFGSQACRLRLPVAFFRASELCESLGVAIHDGSLPKLKAELNKPSLLIIDDLGLSEISPRVGQILLDVVDRRMRSGSLLITSQFPIEQWHSFFSDPTVADAILDRVIHQAYRVALRGESMRKLQARKKMQQE